MLLCTCSIKADPVSAPCLWKAGKVSRLHGSSDIQSGLQRDRTSPSRIYRAARGIKESLLHRTGLCETCSSCPRRRARPLWSLLHRLCMCESLSAPGFLAQQTLAQSAKPPAGGCVERRANTGPAWQTSHLCVCMGTSGPCQLHGALGLPVCLSACPSV